MATKKIPYEEIRDYYNFLTPMIIKRSALKHPSWTMPYGGPVDWITMFTPIESDTWNYIRSFGLMPLYPQYPVGKYFTDFGNPYFKIAIECDGKQFHLDKEKDYKRDCEFKKLGWTVYRVSGADCNRIINLETIDYLHREYDRQEIYNILSDFYKNTVDGLIKSLAIKHCGTKTYHDFEYELAMRVLETREVKILQL